MTIRVALAEDHALVRQAVAAMLAAQTDIAIVGEVSQGTEVAALVAHCRPDVLILDIDLPGKSGIAVMRELQVSCPALAVLGLSAYLERVYVEGILAAGARGFVHKGGNLTELIEGIRRVARNERFLCGNGRSLLAATDSTVENHSEEALFATLSAREREVLQWVASGLSSPEIGSKLGIAAGTVEVHRRNLMRKLDRHSAVELTLFALRTGIVPERRKSRRGSSR